MTRVRLIVVLALVSATSAAFAQQVDYSLCLEGNMVPSAGREVIKTLVVRADRWTEVQEPFVVRLTVPPELAFAGFRGCDGDASYEASTRVATWSGRLTNEYIAFASCPIGFIVLPTLAAGSTFTLNATLTTATPDPNPANNTLTITEMVVAASDVEVSGSVDAERVEPGATLTYTLSVTNHGPGDGQSVILTDRFSPDVTFVSFEQIDGPLGVVDAQPLSCYASECGGYIRGNIGIVPSGSSATYRLVVRMKPGLEAARITNRVSVQSATLDISPQNNSKELVVLAGPSADLAIAGNRGEDAAGGRIPITIQVSNHGPDTVNAVAVHNYLEPNHGYYDSEQSLELVAATSSQGTCSAPEIVSLIACPMPMAFWKFDCAIGALAPGARATITLLVDRGSRDGRFTYRAFVSPDMNDPKPGNNAIFVNPDAPRKRAVRR